MNYDGVVVNILAAETITTAGGDRQKQTIVLEEDRDTEYKWGIVVDFWGEKVTLLSGLQVGDKISVWLNSKAREYNGRRYNAITGWKVDRAWAGWWAAPAAAAASTVATPPDSTTSTWDTAAAPAAKTQEYEDELPF